MNLARISPGDVVLVYGIGAVGLSIVQLARRAGADVIAVSRTPAKLEKALSRGAAHAIDATADSVAERVREPVGRVVLVPYLAGPERRTTLSAGRQ